MALPSKTQVITLDYAGFEGPAVYVPSKGSVDTKTLDYADTEGPIFGATAGATVSQALTATCAGVASMAQGFVYARALTAAVGAVVSLGVLLNKTLSATCASAGSFVRLISLALSGNCSAIALLLKGLVMLDAASATSATFQKQINKTLTAEA